MKHFINSLVKSEEVAEDLSQDMFEYLWINRDICSNLQSLNAYLFRMAKNKAINYLNHKLTEEEYVSSGINVEEYSIEEEFLAKELELLIELAIEKMPRQRRSIQSRISKKTGQKISGLRQGLTLLMLPPNSMYMTNLPIKNLGATV
jgi:RNA polymerase sigma-70 factor (ECF subfamily)